MEYSLPKVLQKYSLTHIRKLYSLSNCINCIKFGENQQETVWEAKHRPCIFGRIIPNWLSKIIWGFCNMVCHILCEFRGKIRKITKRKQEKPLLTFASMSLICPISNGIFPSQSAPKVLLDLYKEIIVIIELYKLHKIGRKSTRSSLGSKSQTLNLWNNYSKLALKNYMRVLQHGLPHSV